MRTLRPSLENRRPVLLSAGLLVAVSFTLISFEWRTPYVAPSFERYISIDEGTLELPPVLFDPLQAKVERPAPPKPISTTFEIVENAPDPDSISKEPVFPEETELLASIGKAPDEPEEVDPEYVPAFVKNPEVLPSYCGGEQALLWKIHENVRYPQICLDNGISGVVYVGFVVKSDGSIGDVKIARGVDRNLDAEALRVVKLLNCFVPGYQAGRPVNVPFVIPIRFKIQ
jgi:protein TonB